MDIDLVYLWVDGSDPVWQAKKDAFIHGASKVSCEAVGDTRFIDNDELKFSLRSVEMYAPWIRHIYIVTDNQVPSWLNLSNSRVSIVDHTKIMPPSSLPTFSSPAIEWCVDNIPGLSEHFLLANDDTFMAQKVSPEFFFNSAGQPVVRLREWTSSKRNMSLYIKTITKAQSMIKQCFGKQIKYIPHHNIDAYRKGDFKICKELFAKEVFDSINRHVRSESDLQRAIIHYYVLAKGEGQMKLMGRYNKPMGLLGKIKSVLSGVYHYETRSISIGRNTDISREMKRYNPILFCLNDNEETSDAARLHAREFLERTFPEKSSFEL